MLALDDVAGERRAGVRQHRNDQAGDRNRRRRQPAAGADDRARAGDRHAGARCRSTGVPLVRPLGIIHRRDRKLSETAQQFVQLLQSQATECEATSPDDRPHRLATELAQPNARWRTRDR